MVSARRAVLFSIVLGFCTGDMPERQPQKAPDVQKVEDLSGTYSFGGVEKDGAYNGVLMMVGEPPVYRVTWMLSDGSTFRGTAMQDDGVLAVGWSVYVGNHPSQGHVMKQGVNVYRRDGEGGWRGKWTTGERVSVESWRKMGK